MKPPKPGKVLVRDKTGAIAVVDGGKQMADGVRGLFTETAAGFREGGAAGIGKGFVAGTSGAVSGLTSGAGTAVSGSLHGVNAALGVKRINQGAKADNAIEGLTQGGKEAASQLSRGIGSAIADPLRGAKEGGLKGFAKGVGTGAQGLSKGIAGGALHL